MVEDDRIFLVYYTHPAILFSDPTHDSEWDLLADIGLSSVYTPDSNSQEMHFDFSCGCGECDMCNVNSVEEAKLAIETKLSELGLQWRFGGQFEYGDD